VYRSEEGKKALEVHGGVSETQLIKKKRRGPTSQKENQGPSLEKEEGLLRRRAGWRKWFGASRRVSEKPKAGQSAGGVSQRRGKGGGGMTGRGCFRH